MELRDLLRALRRFRVLAALAFVLVLGLGALAAYVPPLRYKATATVQAFPPTPTDGGPPDLSAIEAVRFLIPSLVDVIQTRSFGDGVAEALRDRVPAGTVIDLAASNEPGTSIIRVSAQSTVPSQSAVVANAAAQLLITRQSGRIIQLDLIDPAYPPESPSGPLRLPIMLSATVLGAIAAIFTALGLSAIRRRLAGPDELRERFGLEILGEIPRVRRFPATAPELFTSGARPALAEAYNRLRTNFEILLVGKPFAAVAITSCAVGEGKSTVTANLAYAIASLGRTVVAVDGDLRRPALHNQFDIEMGKGVTDVAAGADVSSLLQRPTSSDSLAVITAGESERHPTEAVSTAFPRLLDVLERSDRLVLVDSPPMAVAEATLIAVMTRAVVLVVDAGRRDPTEIARVLFELRQAGADVLGVVVNRVKRPSNRSAYEYYAVAAKRKSKRRSKRRSKSRRR